MCAASETSSVVLINTMTNGYFASVKILNLIMRFSSQRDCGKCKIVEKFGRIPCVAITRTLKIRSTVCLFLISILFRFSVRALLMVDFL